MSSSTRRSAARTAESGSAPCAAAITDDPYAKTPLPDNLATVLGSSRLGSSHDVSIFQDYCVSCGRTIATLHFEIARSVVGAADPVAALIAYMDARGFQMCCRNIVISPLISTVVIGDLGAKFVFDSLCCPYEEDAPRPISDSPSELSLPNLFDDDYSS